MNNSMKEASTVDKEGEKMNNMISAEGEVTCQ